MVRLGVCTTVKVSCGLFMACLQVNVMLIQVLVLTC